MAGNIQHYLAENPHMAGLLLAALGLLFFVGALFRWKWIMQPTSRISLFRAAFGQRAVVFVASTLLIASGMAMFFLYL